jgi:alpha-galactosidase
VGAADRSRWRTDTDVGFGGGRGIHFADLLRNLDPDAAHPEAGGAGHWNDPDYLGPELGMTSGQAQADVPRAALATATRSMRASSYSTGARDRETCRC